MHNNKEKDKYHTQFSSLQPVTDVLHICCVCLRQISFNVAVWNDL